MDTSDDALGKNVDIAARAAQYVAATGTALSGCGLRFLARP
jgi:hypothetical protein